MPPTVLYPFALIGLIAVVAFAALAMLVLIDHRSSRRAAHRKARDSKASDELTPIAGPGAIGPR